MEQFFELHFLRNCPSLLPFFEHEMSILNGEKMTTYLFFSYVVEEAINKAIETKDHQELGRIIQEIEWFAQTDEENKGENKEAIFCTLFEAFENEFKSGFFDNYSGVFLKALWAEYIA